MALAVELQPAEDGLFGLDLVPIHVIATAVALTAFAGLSLMFRGTRLGLILRASAANREALATLGERGIRATVWAFLLGGVCAGLAGVLLATERGVVPTGGLRWLLLGITAMVIAGANFERGLWPGLVVSSGVVATLSVVIAWTAGSTWTDAGVLLVLILCLLVRPAGLFPAQQLRRGV